MRQTSTGFSEMNFGEKINSEIRLKAFPFLRFWYFKNIKDKKVGESNPFLMTEKPLPSRVMSSVTPLQLSFKGNY